MEMNIQKNTAKILTAIALLPIVLCIGAAIPMGMSDNWEKLNGIAMEEDRPYILGDWSGIDRLSSSKPGGFFAKTVVDQVKYTPTGKCVDQEDIRAYTITTKTVGLFGVTLNRVVHRPQFRCGYVPD